MALWTPADTTTSLWLDAADGSTITIDVGVSIWQDKSGNGRNATQAVGTKQPATTATGFNGGYPALDFSGSAKALSVPRGFITSSISAFVVWEGGVVDGRILDQRSTGGLGAVKGWQVKHFQFYVDNGAGSYRSLTNTGLDNFSHIYSSIFPVGDFNLLFRDGTEITTNRTSAGALPTDIDNTGLNIFIGGNADGSATQDFTGLIAEVILVNSVLSDSDRQTIEGYLAWKWGLEANLPIGHPYKDAAPEVGVELLDFTSTGGIILGGTSIISYFVGPIGKFLLSNPPISGLFRGARALFVSPTRDYEDGGIALNDPSQGHLYQRWRCRIFGDYVVLDAEEVLPQVLFVGAELTECSIAFDQNMRPVLAVVEAGQPKLQWYDTSVGEQVITFLDPDVVTPRVTLDDKRPGQTGNSDIILAYVRLGALYYRQQSDRFLIEYLLDTGPHTGINKIGMNKHFRLQFSMMGVAP
jgi:hypothetical protein